MNSLPRIFMGIFAVFAFAWIGLVALPYLELGDLKPQVDPETGEQRPAQRTGLAENGAKVYAANGCLYCHSQQIRPSYAGSDLDRGWGTRQTVPRDYLRERPVFLGTMRTGPDLTNVGVRLTSAEWHHEHLYNPQSKEKESIMPPFRFLYRKQKIQGASSPDALKLTKVDAVEPGYEVVPTDDAKALVAYLLSLKRNYSLKEMPVE